MREEELLEEVTETSPTEEAGRVAEASPTDEASRVAEASPTEEASQAEEAGDAFSEESAEDGGTDFAAMAASDLAELKAIAPHMAGLSHIGELPGAIRYAELREMGLSVREAYLAVGGRLREEEKPKRDNRAHLHASVPKGVASAGASMSIGEMEEARRLFGSLSEREILALYRRVSKGN